VREKVLTDATSVKVLEDLMSYVENVAVKSIQNVMNATMMERFIKNVNHVTALVVLRKHVILAMVKEE
jgi:hypothetical protein